VTGWPEALPKLGKFHLDEDGKKFYGLKGQRMEGTGGEEHRGGPIRTDIEQGLERGTRVLVCEWVQKSTGSNIKEEIKKKMLVHTLQPEVSRAGLEDALNDRLMSRGGGGVRSHRLNILGHEWGRGHPDWMTLPYY